MGWDIETVKRGLLVGLLSGTLLWAAPSEPPAELLEELDFFKAMPMIENDSFIQEAVQPPYEVPASSPTRVEIKEEP